MRQSLKLEKEAILRNPNNNFSRSIKEPKSPALNEKLNKQILNYNPYGRTIAMNKPILTSNYLYNIIKKENENYENNKKKSKIYIVEEAKIK
jgi:hypothetical protein